MLAAKPPVLRRLRITRELCLAGAIGILPAALVFMALDWGVAGVIAGCAMIVLLLGSLLAQVVLWAIEWQQR